YGMSGRAFDSRMLFSWPQSQTSVMGAEQAANTLADVKIRQLARQGQKLSQADIDAIRDPVLGEFKRKQSAYYTTSEIWDDGMLDPVDTRNALGMSISAALNAPIADPRYGVFRM
uniref:carboxyl transferase domain-containing protein n=2 Tax=Solimonas soli TaxID=413479 RepID=UPI002480B792